MSSRKWASGDEHEQCEPRQQGQAMKGISQNEDFSCEGKETARGKGQTVFRGALNYVVSGERG